MNILRQPPTKWAPSVAQLAWCSGFVDGEGCLGLAKQHQRGRPNPTYRPRLHLSQNRREVLDHFQEIVGEAAFLCALKRQPYHRRQTYALVYDGVHALRVIQKLRPYLVRKAKEADVLLSYPESGWMGVHPGPEGYPPEVWAERERIYRDLRDLK